MIETSATVTPSAAFSQTVAPAQGGGKSESGEDFAAHLAASYEANRDLVLMGAYRAGADPQLDRAIAMHGEMLRFLGQDAGQVVPLAQSVAQLTALLTPAPPT